MTEQTKTIATWLADGAVAANLHIPAGKAASAGVVICPPLGQEHILSYRTLRLLADRLADAGVASVRFDYPGHGDSTAASADRALLEGIGIAADALRDAGCQRIVYLGLGIGALLAQEMARTDPDAAGLVMWDPHVSGRRWLRRMRSLYATSVLDARTMPRPDGAVDIIGGELDEPTVALLLALDADVPTPPVPILRAVRRGTLPESRPSTGGQDPTDGANQDATEWIEVDGHKDLLDVDSVVARIPGASVAAVANWIVESFGPETEPTVSLQVPLAERRATLTVEASDGSPVELVEEIVRVGPDQLFGIETRPVGAPAGTPAVLLQTGSAEHRVGPARYQVLQARRLAAQGLRCLRLDRRGAGESGDVSPDEPSMLYTREWVEDNHNAIRFLGLPAERVGVVGLCVGGWLALMTDPRLAHSQIAIGAPAYRVRYRQPDAIRALRYGNQIAAGPSPRRFKDLLKRVLPYRAVLMLARLGKADIVEVLLGPPVRGGADVVLMMAPGDQSAFRNQFGFQALERLRSARGRVTLLNYEIGDHSLFESTLRERVLRDVCDQARRVLGEGSESEHRVLSPVAGVSGRPAA